MKKYHIYEKDIRSLMIPKDRVVHVQPGNPLEHALLVLMKTGYTSVPVLDSAFKLCGLISKTRILEQTLELEKIEWKNLSRKLVEETMETDFPFIKREDSFLRALKLLIHHNFICVSDDDGVFQGIIPRSAVLKYLNHTLHDLLHESVGQ